MHESLKRSICLGRTKLLSSGRGLITSSTGWKYSSLPLGRFASQPAWICRTFNDPCLEVWGASAWGCRGRKRGRECSEQEGGSLYTGVYEPFRKKGIWKPQDIEFPFHFFSTPGEFWGSHCADGLQAICLLRGKSRLIPITHPSRAKEKSLSFPHFSNPQTVASSGVEGSRWYTAVGHIWLCRDQRKAQRPVEIPRATLEACLKRWGGAPDTLLRSHLGQASCFS